MHLANLGEGTSRRLFRLPGKSYGQRRLAWTQHFLWNPALHLWRPSRLHLHRRLNSWRKRSARQTGEHGRPIPFRPSNMLSRLSDQWNSLLWIRCRLCFVRQNSSRSFAEQVLGDCLGTVQVRCANLPNRSWPNRHWAFFLTSASCGRPTSAKHNSVRIRVLAFLPSCHLLLCSSSHPVFPNLET